MAKIFLDVGGYHGESSLAALDPLFGFDRVYCFEPVESCAEIIRERVTDRRFVVVSACLSSVAGRVTIYNPGTLAASLFEDAPSYLEEAPPQEVLSMVASDFFHAFIKTNDHVWMKLNCEGSECDIPESILQTRVCTSIRNVLVDFDARKIPSQKHRVTAILKRIEECNVPHSFPDSVQYGNVTNYGGIRNWLLVSGAKSEGALPSILTLSYNLRMIVKYPETSGYHKLKVLKMFPFLARFARSQQKRATSV